MLGRKNFDEYDDYKKEQAELNRERKREGYSKTSSASEAKGKGVQKLPRLHKKTNDDGNTVYYKSISVEKVTFAFVVPIFLIIMLAMMVNIAGADIKVVSSGTLVPIGFMIVFFLILYYGIYGFAPTANKVEISDKSLIYKVGFWKKKVISYSDFKMLECRRMHGKNNRYTGTRYFIVYKDSSNTKDRKIGFPSSSALDASDFNYEVQKKLLTSNSDATTYEFNESKQFIIPQTRSINAEKLRFAMIIPLIAFFMVMYVYGSMVSKTSVGNTEIPYVVMFFVVAIFIIVISSLKMNKRKWDLTPERITFEPDAIRVGDEYIRSSSVERLYITPIGRNNPLAFNNSTIDIITDNARYSCNLGMFYYGGFRHALKTENVPLWSYDTFYDCAKKWCDANNVEMVDFLI